MSLRVSYKIDFNGNLMENRRENTGICRKLIDNEFLTEIWFLNRLRIEHPGSIYLNASN